MARGGAADIDRAVASARAAFEDGRWARRTPGARKDVLLRLAALIRDNVDELALVDGGNAPELFPTVPVVFSQACSPEAQDLVTKVWTDLLQ